MDERAVQWFGASWQAPVCDPEQEIETPVGELCTRCGDVFGDAGVQGIAIPYLDPIAREFARAGAEPFAGCLDHLYFHRDCFMEVVAVDRRTP